MSGESDHGLARNPVSRLAKRGRSLLVWAGIVMIVLASLKVGSGLLGAQHGQDDAPAEETQAAPAQDVRGSSPAGTASAAGPAQGSTDEPVLSAPQKSEPLEPRSELGSAHNSGAVATADPVPSWLPSLPSSAAPPRGEKTGGAALNSSRARPAGTEPGTNPTATAATIPSPRPSRSAAPAEERGAKQAIASSAAGEVLPPSIGSERLRAAAMNGDAAAQYEIAVRLAEGRRARQDLSAAARWFERAANQGLAPAQFQLAVFYERGRGVKKDRERARRLYAAAAEAGNARAMHNLGVLHAEGIEGKPDYVNAVKWFLKAAEYGLGDSQYNLGVLYARGIGVQTDPAESYKWFALAARAGDQEAEKKRDEIAAQLDPASLAAVRAAVAAWVAKAEPETATTVKPPPGGWDDPAPAVSKNAFNADNAAAPVR